MSHGLTLTVDSSNSVGHYTVRYHNAPPHSVHAAIMPIELSVARRRGGGGGGFNRINHLLVNPFGWPRRTEWSWHTLLAGQARRPTPPDVTSTRTSNVSGCLLNSDSRRLLDQRVTWLISASYSARSFVSNILTYKSDAHKHTYIHTHTHVSRYFPQLRYITPHCIYSSEILFALFTFGDLQGRRWLLIVSTSNWWPEQQKQAHV